MATDKEAAGLWRVKQAKLNPLKAYLNKHADALDAKRVGLFLSDCWDALEGGTETNMRAEKLWRIEEPSWAPPILEFSIERHGQTVNGSSRATIYRWSVNLETHEAGIIGETHRQLYLMDKRLDVKPIAQSLADAIITGKPDARITISKEGSVRLKIGEIIPAACQQTTSARRKRLRAQLSTILAPHGWKEQRPNVYHQPVRPTARSRT
jgi:hypothetical protein